MKNKNLGKSFKNAVDGISYVIKAELNMKLHILAALVVVFLSILYKIGRIETMLVCLTIGSVIICELFNTAIEVLVDLVVDSYHPKAKIVKDVAAGGVLMSAIISVVVGYIIFMDKLAPDAEKIVKMLKNLDIRLTAAALAVIILAVLTVWILRGGKTAAKESIDGFIAFFAFLTASGVILWSGSIEVSVLFLGIAVLITASRIKKKIRNIFELISGAVLGFLVLLLVYQVLS